MTTTAVELAASLAVAENSACCWWTWTRNATFPAASAPTWHHRQGLVPVLLVARRSVEHIVDCELPYLKLVPAAPTWPAPSGTDRHTQCVTRLRDSLDACVTATTSS